MTFRLTNHALKLSEIPSEDVILASARELLTQAESWKQGKTFRKNAVRTFSRAKGRGEGDAWHCRVSEHAEEEAAFDEMWEKLTIDGPANEKQYIPNIRKCTRDKRLSSTQEVWTYHYTFKPPVSPRVFTVLRVTHLDDAPPRTGIIVSIPIDLSDQDGAVGAKEREVRGRYVSVERLLALDNGKTEWRMATSSTPGGYIPDIITDLVVAGEIAADVGQFMRWLQTLKSTADTAADLQTSSEAPNASKPN